MHAVGRHRLAGLEWLGRALAAWSRLPPAVAGGLLVVTLALAWTASYVGGGSRTPLPHLFYLPILAGASRFGVLGALLVALAAGLVAGPLLPADSSTGTPQPAVAWLGRLLAFLVVGAVVAGLVHESRRSLTQRLQDIRLAGELRDALHRQQLSTVFQPIIDLTSGTIVGVEALCRWRHPQRGDIRPDEFIPAAERTGLVHDIGHLVLSDTLAQLRRWDDTGRVVASAAVNVSATELADPALVDRVRAALHAWGIAPERLVIEVTETAVISDFVTASRQLAALRGLGIRIAIDDFGTGQSSLAYLRRFDLDIVKIDREFVRDILACPKAERMVQAIIRLAAAMGAETVAEGIESSAEANRLRRLGCQVGQGYHLGRPMPARELDALLSTHTAVRPGRSAPLHTTRPDVDSAVRAAFHRT